jgi:uncharacterized SAM-binding protein YcdF (DUF218 family)
MGSARIKGLILRVSAGLVAAGVLGFIAFATVATRTADNDTPVADGIVVLTGGEARIAEAGRLLQSGKARRLLVSGVNRRTNRDDLLRIMKLDPQLFDCCVDLGYEALDTFGNADEARVWASRWHFSRLIIVTASYHMPRSLAEIALALPEAILVPHVVVPRHMQGTAGWMQISAARALLTEYLKFIPVVTRLAMTRIGLPREPEVNVNRNADPEKAPGSLAAKL